MLTHRYECFYCDEAFEKRSTWTRHESTHTRDRPYRCSHKGCSWRGAFKLELKEHTRTHLGKAFKCDLCDKLFTLKSLVKLHKKAEHSDEPSSEHRTFKCKQCDKTFLAQRFLDLHKKVDHGFIEQFQPKRSHRCQFCKKAFGYEENFILHLKTHR